MRTIKLLALAGLALCAFAVAGTAVAGAEMTGFLCLVAGCQNVEGTLKGGAFKLETLKGKAIKGTGVEALLKNCEAVAGTEEKHVTLCKDVPIHFTGVTFEGANCKTEGDEKGIVLLLLDLHLASEKTAAGVLEPLLIMLILNAKLENKEVTITCGVIKNLIKGAFACLLLPGLANISTAEEVEVSCKIKNSDQETGKECELLCEVLIANPFLANFGGGFEDAALELSLKGKLSKDVFIDD